ncbi:GPI ethanolamine phosphate transferase 2 [Diabrotica undecimpunctata]|uniref:GPI ethanolamine phosphate transferase 2 n=1 Tax=Diabrotica undecimpunctata TaxID=50387 RepID=UPI003B63960B
MKNMTIYLLGILSAFLFFYGFFPISTRSNDINNIPPSKINNVPLKQHYFYNQSNFKKTVLIVIDALRLDFVNTKYMPLTTNLLQENGCSNEIKVEIPTVTLPRIKALTVGNIPQFIDLVLNLASTESLSDSIIHSAYENGKNIVFYGDDTWLKLFPNKFSRHEGVSSFFVRDFTEVDLNVTRNVYAELKNDDWDIMILHYLGLDHIGHVYGPFSSLVPPKLNEMDNIIHTVFEKLSSKGEEVLLMVTGDHGMKDSGGHGGSTYSETHVPLVIVGHRCENTSLSQSDIPVNLAVLMGVKIPSSSIGKVHRKLLQTNEDKYLYDLYYNSIILQQKESCCHDLFDEASSHYIKYLNNNTDSISTLKAIKLYEKFLEKINDNLANGSIKQKLTSLFIALFVLLNVIIIIYSQILSKQNKNYLLFQKIVMLALIIVQFNISEHLLVFSVMISILIVILFSNIYFLLPFNFHVTFSYLNFFIFISILHPLTFISSSYVEEEHQYWYFFNTLFIFFNCVTFSKMKSKYDVLTTVVCLAMFRFLRRMNSTGDKWAMYPDLSGWLLKDENYLYYQLLFLVGLVSVLVAQYVLLLPKRPWFIHFISIATLCLIFIYKQRETSITLGRIVWFLVFVQLIMTYNSSKIIPWILIATLLLKPYNVILIPYCVLCSLYFSKHLSSTQDTVLYHTILANMLYFTQGHSNSLASVDVSVGYIGLSEYQPIFVIAQVLCHIQTFPVLCHLLIFNNKNIKQGEVWNVLFCNKLYVYLVTCIVTFLFRHHLFIWSVFAPKLFIEFVHILFLCIEYLLVQICTMVHIGIGLNNFLYRTKIVFFKKPIVY